MGKKLSRREKNRIALKKFYSNPENKKKWAAYMKEYRSRPHVEEYVKKYNSKYYKKNKERLSDYMREYWKRPENKERKKRINARYYLKRKERLIYGKQKRGPARKISQ